MEKKSNTPEPLRASATAHLGFNVITSATAKLGPQPKPPWVKRPWVKIALKEVAIELIKEGIKALMGLIFGRQRQPAEAGQP